MCILNVTKQGHIAGALYTWADALCVLVNLELHFSTYYKPG